MRRERVFRDGTSPLDTFNVAELVKRNRCSRVGITHIAVIVALDIQRETRRNFALLPYQQVLLALQYYASGTFQVIVGDPLHVSQPTACSAKSGSLSRKINGYMKCPNNIDVQPIKIDFYKIRQFPGVIGCVDGTRG